MFYFSRSCITSCDRNKSRNNVAGIFELIVIDVGDVIGGGFLATDKCYNDFRPGNCSGYEGVTRSKLIP